MPMVRSFGGSEIVKTSWIPQGKSGRTVCTNAEAGKYYLITTALYRAGSPSYTNIEIIDTPVWDANTVGVVFAKCTNSGTIYCNTSGTVNHYRDAVELTVE